MKVDVAYPYGEKHEQFGKLSAALSSNPDILVAEVGVKDYGDKENVNIAERYNIVKEEYPVMLLFTEGKTEPIRYQVLNRKIVKQCININDMYLISVQGEFKLDMMQRFVSSTSGLWIGLPGCLEVFDGLANRFVASKNPSDRKEILRHSEDEWDKVSLGSERKSAEVYVKVMRKMLEKGDDFLQMELSRVDTLRKGKLAKEMKEEIKAGLTLDVVFEKKHG